MSTKYKFRDQEQIYFVSFAVVYWIDVFIREEYKQIIIDSLKYCQKEKGLEIYAYCLMTSHIHLIIGTDKNPLQDILRDFKSHTSRKLKKAIKENPKESRREWMIWMMERAGKKNSNNINFQFWQQNNHPIVLDNNRVIDDTLEYIHNNPIEAGFCEKQEEYLYSSARDYCKLKGLLEIKLIE